MRTSAARTYYYSEHSTNVRTGVSLGSWVSNQVDLIPFFLLAEWTFPLLEMYIDIQRDRVDLKQSLVKYMTFMLLV